MKNQIIGIVFLLFGFQWLLVNHGDKLPSNLQSWVAAHMTSKTGNVEGTAMPLMTLADVSKFDGKKNAGLMLVLWARVFNVSTGDEFYSPGNAYDVFAGQDCSWCMAHISTSPEHLNRDLADLDEKALDRLNETYWGTYVRKYPIVAVLADPPYNPSLYDKYAGSFSLLKQFGVSGPHDASGSAFTGASEQSESKCPMAKMAKKIGNAVGKILPQFFLSSPPKSDGTEATKSSLEL